jgi:hypothetical protein
VTSRCLYANGQRDIENATNERTCRASEEYILALFHDEVKHVALLLAELSDRGGLVGATGGAEGDARCEEGTDLGLFGRASGSVFVVAVVGVGGLAFLGVDGFELVVLTRRRRHRRRQVDETRLMKRESARIRRGSRALTFPLRQRSSEVE